MICTLSWSGKTHVYAGVNKVHIENDMLLDHLDHIWMICSIQPPTWISPLCSIPSTVSHISFLLTWCTSHLFKGQRALLYTIILGRTHNVGIIKMAGMEYIITATDCVWPGGRRVYGYTMNAGWGEWDDPVTLDLDFPTNVHPIFAQINILWFK